MSNNESNYWCYQCQLEIAPLMVPNPTCPWCRNDFVEEIVDGNDPRDFMEQINSSEQEDETENLSYGSNNSGLTNLIQLLSQIQNFSNFDSNSSENNFNNIENNVRGRGTITATATDTATDTATGTTTGTTTTTTTTINSDGTHSVETTIEEISSEPEEPAQDSRVESFLNFINLIMNNGETRPETTPTIEQVDGEPRPRNAPRATIVTINNENGTTTTTTTTTIDQDTSEEDIRPNTTVRGVDSLYQLLTNMLGNPGDYAVGPNAIDDIVTRLMDHGSDSAINRGAADDVINRLEKRFATEKDQFCKAECSICTDNFNAGDMLISLPCEHEYHSACIESWLKLNATCPICRYTITEQDVETDVISID